MSTHSFFYLMLALACVIVADWLYHAAADTLAWLNVQGIPSSWVLFGFIVCALTVTLLAWAQSVKHDA